MTTDARLEQAMNSIVREVWGRLLSLLAYQFRDLELAEDVLQDAVERALSNWPKSGIPDNPAAWLLTTAKRVAIDDFRRAKTFEQKRLLLEADARIAMEEEIVVSDEDIPDERLRLIFTCCHPALNREAQLILTLRTLGGLSTSDIAHALLMAEPTVGQRITRAKRKIRDAGIPFQTPSAADLPDRLDTVLNVIYLIYNEGYVASAGDSLFRVDLATEAIRLGRVLVRLMPDEPEAIGLLALMVLNDSRRDARVDENGVLVTLDNQDRTRWNRTAIAEGTALVDRALRMRRVGPYQIQASISAIHCQAATPEDTDWAQIVALYDVMMTISPTPIVALNRAVAVSMAEGPENGLLAISQIDHIEELEEYHLLHSTRADMLRRAARFDEAREAYQRAINLTNNTAERGFLTQRVSSLAYFSKANPGRSPQSTRKTLRQRSFEGSGR
jgi:RNA polymerase sigma-70 factor (ECF subfamily)